MKCPYCGLDPYEYVDVGIGMIPIAVNCCEPGYALYATDTSDKEIVERYGTPEEWQDEIERKNQEWLTTVKKCGMDEEWIPF